jgi:hypothetical protein
MPDFIARPLAAILVFLVYDAPGLLFGLVFGVGGGFLLWVLLDWLVDAL